MVNVTDRPYVAVRLGTLKFFLCHCFPLLWAVSHQLSAISKPLNSVILKNLVELVTQRLLYQFQLRQIKLAHLGLV